MTELRLRPRTVTEIVDAAFALYRRNAGQYMAVAALAVAPVILLELLLPGAGIVGGELNLLSRFFVTCVSLVSYSLVAGFVIALGSRAYLGEEVDVGAALRDAGPRVPALIAASIMKNILLFIGVLCLIVGAFYVAARFFAVEAVIVLERTRSGEAFTRSSVLSHTRKRHVLNTLLLVGIVYFVLLLGLGGLSAMVGSDVLDIVMSNALMIVVLPIVQLTVMVLYYDARIRGEGFDLEQMTAALDAGAPPAS